MGDENRPSIFDLYARSSEPITLTDQDGNSVVVCFVKRTEASRRRSDEYARRKNKEALDNVGQRRRELTDVTYAGLDKAGLVTALMAFKESDMRMQGLDLFDNLTGDEPDAPHTEKEAEELREKRFGEWLERQQKEYDDQEDVEKLRFELAENQAFHEYNLRTSQDHLDMTIVEILRYFDASAPEGERVGGRVFDNIEQLEQVHPRLLKDLHRHLQSFLAPEVEAKARRLANDPNSLTPAE